MREGGRICGTLRYTRTFVSVRSIKIFGIWPHANRQTDRQTYTRILQCCHAGVGLTHARPNYTLNIYIQLYETCTKNIAIGKALWGAPQKGGWAFFSRIVLFLSKVCSPHTQSITELLHEHIIALIWDFSDTLIVWYTCTMYTCTCTIRHQPITDPIFSSWVLCGESAQWKLL